MWKLVFVCFILFVGCSKNSNNNTGGNGNNNSGNGNGNSSATDIQYWVTKGDQSLLLTKINTPILFAGTFNGNSAITVDSTNQFQSVDGFGYTLTDGSATLINNLNANDRNALLKELFGSDSTSISVSYLRLSMGASDLSASVYSYDDMPSGQTDSTLQNFSLRTDKSDMVAVLKQILAINPNMKLIATPWSPPLWMKDNNNSISGSLLPAYYDSYALYFVKYIQAMAAQGIRIDAITPQNEPLNPYNNPSMNMTAAEEDSFVTDHLGPAFQAASLTTKIIIWDHNCDHPDYPITILNDAAARPYVDGSAFHLYAGDISALSQVHSAYPDKNIYFTEQYTASTGDFSGDLKWHLKNVIIGSMRNWSKNALEWNLGNDQNFQPHTNGGCTTCKGAITFGSTITRNVAYYIVAHASKFVPPGSIRIGSNYISNLYNVAFLRPDGKKVLIVENDGATSQSFNIQFNNKWAPVTIDGSTVATFIW